MRKGGENRLAITRGGLGVFIPTAEVSLYSVAEYSGALPPSGLPTNFTGQTDHAT